ncbi:hypothetical protein CLHUN_01880 [Ruminiclostridium hungatei]|uniref:Uncharacterized protein n=1 Tax=Ruminiclostridium hungatei TaxID=48256 RepID=A0A1V4SR78_RUMHU|nr:hypothetical protein [Ruminiclostridium hungatei]OPX46372.1 hypothetical protein CLHUN_01880 [Ruminiclostridium hungatei]
MINTINPKVAKLYNRDIEGNLQEIPNLIQDITLSFNESETEHSDLTPPLECSIEMSITFISAKEINVVVGFDAFKHKSNNWRKMHGLPMSRR